MLYYCDVCIICTSNRSDYNKHLLTKKHLKHINSQSTQTKCNEVYNSKLPITATITETNIMLNICDIDCNGNVNGNGNGNDNEKNTKRMFNKIQRCKYCGGGYSYSSGLSRHMKKCNGSMNGSEGTAHIDALSDDNSSHNLNNIITVLMHENKEFKQMLVDVMKTNQDTTNKVLELCKNNTNNKSSITNNIYNHKGDNKFSINVFLNEQCRDAMNMTDFVKSIDVTMEDMENVGSRGYVKGISSIFIDSLKNTDIHKRPIHCSDRKRDILYVKDADIWQRDGVDSEKLKNAVRAVEQKSIGRMNEWAKQHPECENSDTRANDVYMKLSRGVLDGDDDNILKVVKNIAKVIVIEKDEVIL